MSSELLNINTYAARLARKLGLAAGLTLSLTLMAIVTTFGFSYYRLVVDKAFSSHVESFSFWLQVNDRYQIQRALAGIVESQRIDGAVVVDLEDHTIAQKGDEQIVPRLNEKSWIALAGSGFLLRYNFPLLESGLIPQAIGEIKIGVLVPYWYIILCLVASALLITGAVRLTRRSFAAVAARMTDPVTELAASVSKAKNLDDLRAIDRSSTGFAELQLLTDKIGEMSERLVDQESVIQKAERAKEVYNIGRQVAHDIRSPLSALRMAVQTAEDMDPDRRSLILSATERIDGIASDLLDRSRAKVDAGGFDVVTSSEQVVSEKKGSFSNSKINLNFKVDNLNGSQHKASGTSLEFQRILSNLINNSLESLNETGTIKVLVRNGERICVQISDDGAGIPPEVLAKLNRGDTVTTKEKGNGLGLSHARKTLAGWGGSLQVKSEVGNGTVVTVYLPSI